MKAHAKGIAIFLAYLVVTNLVIAPVVRKLTPKDASGNPIISLL